MSSGRPTTGDLVTALVLAGATALALWSTTTRREPMELNWSAPDALMWPLRLAQHLIGPPPGVDYPRTVSPGAMEQIQKNPGRPLTRDELRGPPFHYSDRRIDEMWLRHKDNPATATALAPSPPVSRSEAYAEGPLTAERWRRKQIHDLGRPAGALPPAAAPWRNVP